MTKLNCFVLGMALMFLTQLVGSHYHAAINYIRPIVNPAHASIPFELQLYRANKHSILL